MLYIPLLLLLVLVSVCLVGVVLIQSGRGAGLSGAFGMGEGQAVFGSRAGDVLTKATEVFAVAFMVLCIAVAWQSKHRQDSWMGGTKSGGLHERRSTPLATMEEVEMTAKQTNATETAAGDAPASSNVLDTATGDAPASSDAPSS